MKLLRALVLLIGAETSAVSAVERDCTGGAPTPSDAQSEWQLVWADEFNEEGRPDPLNWRFETGFVRNEELQWYQAENARCDGECLVIEARRERKQNRGYDPEGPSWQTNRPHAPYTSASLLTKGLHNWQYGRFE